MDASGLDEMAFDQNVESVEKMSIDQLFRARLQFALSQNASIFAQTQFADAKAGTLLALIGLLTAHVAGGGMSVDPIAVRALLALNALVILACVAVLIPRTGKSADRGKLALTDRFSWPSLTGEAYTGEDHADFVRRAQASQLVLSVARANATVARILFAKYRMLRIAFALALVDVAATLAAAALARGP
jgi:hypothetical protein